MSAINPDIMSAINPALTDGNSRAQPHKLGKRSAGVLLHVASLPTPYGIGDLGEITYDFADKLAAAGQTFWQILPLNPSNPTSGESPYFSSSAFAGNPLLIDLEALADWGLLDKDELAIARVSDGDVTDFSVVRPQKLALLARAVNRFDAESDKEFAAFCASQSHWLEDYALFTVLTRLEGTALWSDWPEAYRDREPNAIERLKMEQSDALNAERIIQYWFYKQWHALKAYCNELGLYIFGDMPIYVSYASADVWANAHLFKLDESKRPTFVSGVPPDYFSSTGQLWNNPVYNWEALCDQGYRWWIDRMGGLFDLYDMVRIDHFRGLVQYWQIPAGEPTAINGSWEDVPTYELFDALIAAHPTFPAVVEDLGLITEDVIRVKEHYQFQGMHLLQFAFDDDDQSNPHRPENHPSNALVYVGTHDNTTVNAWLGDLSEHARARLNAQLNCKRMEAQEIEDQVLELAMSSPANIAIVTAQDLLHLPARARVNDPAFIEGNWRWRMTRAEYAALPFNKLRELTQLSARSALPPTAAHAVA